MAVNIPKYTKNKCVSKFMQGYSGCMCEYCDWYKSLNGPWKAGHHGGPSNCEIFIARSTNRHGFASWGWDGRNEKIIISSGPLPKSLFNAAIRFSKARANTLNKSEKKKRLDKK